LLAHARLGLLRIEFFSFLEFLAFGGLLLRTNFLLLFAAQRFGLLPAACVSDFSAFGSGGATAVGFGGVGRGAGWGAGCGVGSGGGAGCGSATGVLPGGA